LRFELREAHAVYLKDAEFAEALTVMGVLMRAPRVKGRAGRPLWLGS
jgi:hypothetical protein